MSPHACVRTLPVTSFQRFGDGFLHGHAAAESESQIAEIHGVEAGRVQQRVEQRVHAAHVRELVLAHLGHESREVARIGDEYVAPAEHDEQQAVRRQREDVIQRQRGDERGRIARKRWAYPLERLQHVRHHVAVVSIAPLATPVVPPVYCRNAMSSCVSFTGCRRTLRAFLQRLLEALARRAGCTASPACACGARRS